jgi:hypothetical protein
MKVVALKHLKTFFNKTMKTYPVFITKCQLQMKSVATTIKVVVGLGKV